MPTLLCPPAADPAPELLTLAREAESPAVRAGLLLLLDMRDEAHAVCQDDPTSLGSAWHAVVHRREGDFDNALYWVRMSGDAAWAEGPDPRRLIAECRRAGSTNPDALLDLQRQEWACLMDRSGAS